MRLYARSVESDQSAVRRHRVSSAVSSIASSIARVRPTRSCMRPRMPSTSSRSASSSSASAAVSLLAAPAPSARASVYAVTGDNVSAAAGRVWFVLGRQGPCSSVDTACSSALAALHGAGHAVRGGESNAALALAVSLKLVPHGTLGMASAGMLSVDGRCKTLDARANGYARSEGVGALVLRQGDGAILALCGSAVRQDGRSASLTAPNGSAQRALLHAALAEAGVAAAGVARRVPRSGRRAAGAGQGRSRAPTTDHRSPRRRRTAEPWAMMPKC